MRYLRNLLVESDLNDIKHTIAEIDCQYIKLQDTASIERIFNEDVATNNFPDIRNALDTAKSQYVAIKRSLELIETMRNSPEKESRRVKINSLLNGLKKRLMNIVSQINLETSNIQDINKRNVASREQGNISPIESSDLNRAI